MILTLAQQVPTIYVCQRAPGEKGYPPGTPDILGQLLNVPSLKDGPLAGGSRDPDLFIYCRCVAFLQTAYAHSIALGKLHQETPRYILHASTLAVITTI